MIRRAASYSDFYHVAKAQLSKDAIRKQKRRSIKKDRNWDALMLPVNKASADRHVEVLNVAFDISGDAFLEASQQEYLYEPWPSTLHRYRTTDALPGYTLTSSRLRSVTSMA